MNILKYQEPSSTLRIRARKHLNDRSTAVKANMDRQYVLDLKPNYVLTASGEVTADLMLPEVGITASYKPKDSADYLWSPSTNSWKKGDAENQYFDRADETWKDRDVPSVYSTQNKDFDSHQTNKEMVNAAWQVNKTPNDRYNMGNDEALQMYYQNIKVPMFKETNPDISEKDISLFENSYPIPLDVISEYYQEPNLKRMSVGGFADSLTGKIEINTYYTPYKSLILHENDHRTRQYLLGRRGTGISGSFNRYGFSPTEWNIINHVGDMSDYQADYNPTIEILNTLDEVRFHKFNEYKRKYGHYPSLEELRQFNKEYPWEKTQKLIRNTNAYGSHMYKNGSLNEEATREFENRVAYNQPNNLLQDRSLVAKQGLKLIKRVNKYGKNK